MKKLILISLFIFFAICSKSWAEDDYNTKKQQLINDALKTVDLPECERSPKVGGQVTWNNCLGPYTWTNGNFYIGVWKNGKKHNFGTQVWASGSSYTGEWSEGKRHGQGTHTLYNGDIYEGIWHNDRCKDCNFNFEFNKIKAMAKNKKELEARLKEKAKRMTKFRQDKVKAKERQDERNRIENARQEEIKENQLFDNAKIECEAIGYKKGTEKFGECVLDLTE